MNKLDRQTRRQSEKKKISKTRTEVKKREWGGSWCGMSHMYLFFNVYFLVIFNFGIIPDSLIYLYIHFLISFHISHALSSFICIYLFVFYFLKSYPNSNIIRFFFLSLLILTYITHIPFLQMHFSFCVYFCKSYSNIT